MRAEAEPPQVPPAYPCAATAATTTRHPPPELLAVVTYIVLAGTLRMVPRALHILQPADFPLFAALQTACGHHHPPAVPLQVEEIKTGKHLVSHKKPRLGAQNDTPVP